MPLLRRKLRSKQKKKLYGKSYEHPWGYWNKDKVLNTILKLGNVGPIEIYRYIEANRHEPISQNKLTKIAPVVDTQNLYAPSNGSQPEWLRKSKNIEATNAYMVDTDIKPMLDNEHMSLVTVKHWCKELTKEGIVDHKDNKYSISHKAAKELRYFATMFNSQSLYYLSQFPLKNTEKNIQEFVTRFGALMIYAFIIAASPFKDKTADKDRIIMNWIQHAIPITKMFQYFFAAFVSVPKADGTLYELDSGKVAELSAALKSCYPDIYESLEKANWIRTK